MADHQVDPAVGDLRVAAQALLSEISIAEAHLIALRNAADSNSDAAKELRAEALATRNATQELIDANAEKAAEIAALQRQLHALEAEDAAIGGELRQLSHTTALLTQAAAAGA